jgi:hypothetical protein
MDSRQSHFTSANASTTYVAMNAQRMLGGAGTRSKHAANEGKTSNRDEPWDSSAHSCYIVLLTHRESCWPSKQHRLNKVLESDHCMWAEFRSRVEDSSLEFCDRHIKVSDSASL